MVCLVYIIFFQVFLLCRHEFFYLIFEIYVDDIVAFYGGIHKGCLHLGAGRGLAKNADKSGHGGEGGC